MKLPQYAKNNGLAALVAYREIRNGAGIQRYAVMALRKELSRDTLLVTIEFPEPTNWWLLSHTWSEVEDATEWDQEDLKDEIDRVLDYQMGGYN